MNEVLKSCRKYLNNFSDSQRVFWLSNIGIIGLVSSLWISLGAWSAERTYPLAPIIDGFELSPNLQSILLVVTVLPLLSSLFKTRFRKYFISLGLISALILVSLDITRLQPWALHYFGILALFSFLLTTKYTTSSKILDAARIIIVGIYFWSGFHKISVRFFTEIFPWFTERLWTPFGEVGLYIALILGIFAPFIETSFAVGLLTKKFRMISLVGAGGMLVLVLMSIGPFGLAWNSTVWPWNIGIFAMVLVLFWKTDFNIRTFFSSIRNNTIAKVAIVLFWIMPLGNIVGLTDHYLSWSLYSGKATEAALFGDQLFLESLSPEADKGELRFVRWAQDELSVVPYPEARVFESLFYTLCETYQTEPITMVINHYTITSANPAYQKNFECNQS